MKVVSVPSLLFPVEHLVPPQVERVFVAAASWQPRGQSFLLLRSSLTSQVQLLSCFACLELQLLCRLTLQVLSSGTLVPEGRIIKKLKKKHFIASPQFYRLRGKTTCV